jgi:hypothetical protein
LSLILTEGSTTDPETPSTSCFMDGSFHRKEVSTALAPCGGAL